MMDDPNFKNAKPSPPSWDYTGYAGFDKQLSLLVNFILQGFDNGSPIVMPAFLASIGPGALIPIIEMRRAGYRTATVSLVMLVVAVTYQNFGAAVILPLWWAVHLLLAGREVAPLQPQYVKATLVGYILGYMGISLTMINYQTPAVVAVWQFFPAHILLVQAVALAVQRFLGEDTPGSSHKTLQAIHAVNFGWSALAHTYTVSLALASDAPFDSLKHSFLPTYSPAFLGRAVAFSQMFCKWDVVYVTASTLFVGLWYLRGARQRFIASALFVSGSLFFGAGAGISAVWMLREKQLEEEGRVLPKQPKQG